MPTRKVADLKSLWHDMAAAAPDEVRGDAETVRDTWDEVSDAAKHDSRELSTAIWFYDQEEKS